MVLIDDHSKYPVVSILRTVAAAVVISKLRTIFAQFGIPTVLKTDNGPPFHSGDFSRFAEEFGFKHHRVTPLWPKANGEAERFMRTLNKLVLASRIGGKDWTEELQSFLLAYRSTPHGSIGTSPFELLFKRTVRNLLPVIPDPDNSSPTHINSQRNDESRKRYNKEYADARRHTQHHKFVPGNLVICRQERRYKFTPFYDPKPYTVIKVHGSRVKASRNGRVTTRNAAFFKDASQVTITPGREELDIEDPGPPPSNPGSRISLDHRSSLAPSAPPMNRPNSAGRRYPTRVRRAPRHLSDFAV